jgi:hypothetical protein
MSRGNKFITRLALLGLSVFLCVGPATAALTVTSSAVGGTDELAPGPVGEVTAELDLESGTSVLVSWALAADDFVRQTPVASDFTSGGVFVNVNDVTSYNVWRQAVGAAEAELVGSVSAGETSFADDTVVTGETYTYLVTAADASGNESSAVESGQVNLGPPPTAESSAFTAGSLDLGDAGVDDQLAETFSFTNNPDDPEAVLIVVAEISGAGFSVDPASLGIAAGETDGVDVIFTAADVGNINGAYIGVLTITTNDLNNRTTIINLTASISGGLAVGGITVSGAFNFASVAIGSTKDLTLTIGNSGDLDLTGSLAVAGDAVFTASDAVFSLAGGEELAVTVTFAPTDAQSYSGSIVISSDDPNQPEVTVDLSGSGFDPGDVQILVDADGNTILGDLDGSAAVDFDDFFIFADSFGATGESAADLDGNLAVNFDDFFIFADNFGKSGTYVGG